jgi:hypothetical protein
MLFYSDSQANHALIKLGICINGRCTDITTLDPSRLAVCDNLRISRHQVFAKVAVRDKSSTGCDPASVSRTADYSAFSMFSTSTGVR